MLLMLLQHQPGFTAAQQDLTMFIANETGRGTAYSASACPFTGRECLHIGCTERLSADAPLAAAHLLDDHPGHAAHGLTLDLDHGVSQFLHNLLLLRGSEDFLDQAYLNQWHRFLLSLCSDLPASLRAKSG